MVEKKTVHLRASQDVRKSNCFDGGPLKGEIVIINYNLDPCCVHA